MSLRDELRDAKDDRDFWKGYYERSSEREVGLHRRAIEAEAALAEAQFDAAEAHPYIHLAEDLLTLIPSLNQYVCTCEESTGWDFEAISRAADHKRNRDELEAFEAIVGVEQ